MWRIIGRYASECGAITAKNIRRKKHHQLSVVVPASLIIGHRPVWFVMSYIPKGDNWLKYR